MRRLVVVAVLLLGACSLWQDPPAQPPVAGDSARKLAQPLVAEQSEATSSLLREPIQSEGTWAEPTDASVMRSISLRVRQRLMLPKGKFPKSAKVQVAGDLTPSGTVVGARISKSSGYKKLDRAVLLALARAQPLPVPPSVRQADRALPLQLVFNPVQ